jgi:hypothetical protein
VEKVRQHYGYATTGKPTQDVPSKSVGGAGSSGDGKLPKSSGAEKTGTRGYTGGKNTRA